MSTVHMKKNDEINTGSTLDRNQDNSACEGVLEEIFKDIGYGPTCYTPIFYYDRRPITRKVN